MPADQPIFRNRWDLLELAGVAPPSVSVVITHFEQPRQLARTYAALTAQTLPPGEIVVADDGSPTVPDAADLGPGVIVVSQPDRGFRAAAARNLGARHCHGDILVFVDADTSPEPAFIERVTRRVAACRDVVAVGRRRHADLRGSPVGADPAGAPRFDEPAWLSDGYAGTRNLLDADGRSFRYVISAALACRRRLFDELGGFDERFVGYGGEDWDFAYRAWNGGAVLVHEPTAVTWHDGPDWAGRQPHDTSHELQSIRLAQLIPEPSTRGVPLPHALPDVLVDVAPGLPVTELVRCVHSVLDQHFRDLRVRLPAGSDDAAADLYGPNVATLAWSEDQTRRARARLLVRHPLPDHAIDEAMHLMTDGDLGTVSILTDGKEAATLTSTRAGARANRWKDHFDRPEAISRLFGVAALDVGPPVGPRQSLAGYFSRPRPRPRVRPPQE